MISRTFIRNASTKLSPEEARRQATQLAVQSLKDFGSLLSNSSEETQPINTAPVFENPRLFASLSLLHQGQVLKELQEKYDKNWNKLSLKDKNWDILLLMVIGEYVKNLQIGIVLLNHL